MTYSPAQSRTVHWRQSLLGRRTQWWRVVCMAMSLAIVLSVYHTAAMPALAANLQQVDGPEAGPEQGNAPASLYLPRIDMPRAETFPALALNVAQVDTGAESAFLKVDGWVIRNQSGTGDVVQWRGTNFGGWLLQESWMMPMGDPALDRSGWFGAAFNGASTAAAFDGDPNTSWTGGTPQSAGQWFLVDMGQAQGVERVTFSVGTAADDYPRVYQVQAHDGSSWVTVGGGQGTNGEIVVRFPRTLLARYIRVLQLGSSTNAWTIAEFNAHMADDFNLRRVLNARFGADGAEDVLAAYQDSWIQASDLDQLQSLGLNVVRVPIHWQVLMNTDGSMKPDAVAFRKLDWVIEASSQRGLYVILDLHGAPGAACPWQSCGQAKSNALWTNASYQDWTVQIWERLATRYAGNPTVAAYDLLNEPLVSDGTVETTAQVQQKFDFYDRLYDAVRAIDPDHIIIMAAFFDWEQALPPTTYGWTNVVYQIHTYNFEEFPDWSAVNATIDRALGKMWQYQRQWQVPVYAGEFWFWEHDTLYEKWFSGLNALGVSWTTWTYKVKNNEDGSPLNSFSYGGNWGLFTSATPPIPDVNSESADAIQAKWSQFTTSNFTPNTELQALVASASTPGVWMSLQAVENGRYVGVGQWYSPGLVANRLTANIWAQYVLVTNADGTVSLLSLVNRRYVTADVVQDGKLVARASGILAWEKFRVVELEGGAVALQAVANDKFVGIDLSQSSPQLMANRDSASSAAESFIIVPLAP